MQRVTGVSKSSTARFGRCYAIIRPANRCLIAAVFKMNGQAVFL